MAHPSSSQLPLGIALRESNTLDTYYAGDNQQALDQIKQAVAGKGETFIYLWGREGVGRSHLLQGACQEASHLKKASVYIPLSSNPSDPRQLLEGLERLTLVCIDDIDKIAGQPLWEEAIFYLYNRLRSAQHYLIVSASQPPKALPFTLADLQSRLSWGVTYQIHPLDDDQLLVALQLRAKERGLVLPEEVGAFLIKRSMRAMPHLYTLLDNLDKASLAAKRKLTIPFVKLVLNL